MPADGTERREWTICTTCGSTCQELCPSCGASQPSPPKPEWPKTLYRCPVCGDVDIKDSPHWHPSPDAPLNWAHAPKVEMVPVVVVPAADRDAEARDWPALLRSLSPDQVRAVVALIEEAVAEQNLAALGTAIDSNLAKLDELKAAEAERDAERRRADVWMELHAEVTAAKNLLRAERDALRGVLAAVREAVERYPPEVMDADGSWRIGGAAKRAWLAALAAAPEGDDA